MSLKTCALVLDLSSNIGNHIGQAEDLAVCVFLCDVWGTVSRLCDVWGTVSRLRVSVAADLRNAETSIECILPLEIQTRLPVIYQKGTLKTTRFIVISRPEFISLLVS